MAICTTHVAFFYLGGDVLPGCVVNYHLCDRLKFNRVGFMIELKNDWVGFTTVNAGMTQKVIEYSSCLLLSKSVSTFSVSLFEEAVVIVIAPSPNIFVAPTTPG
jgi:hypothetical protein